MVMNPRRSLSSGARKRGPLAGTSKMLPILFSNSAWRFNDANAASGKRGRIHAGNAHANASRGNKVEGHGAPRSASFVVSRPLRKDVHHFAALHSGGLSDAGRAFRKRSRKRRFSVSQAPGRRP